MEAKVYKLIIPLQQLALRKISILLWNRFYSDSRISLSRKQLLPIVKKLKKKVPLLSLPFSLEDELIDLMLPIATEIQRWKEYHQSFIVPMVDKSELGQLCWTSQGNVDYCKTAERLIKLGRVNNAISYELSCLYCFEDDILKFWEEMQESTKQSYICREIFDDFPYRDESWRTRRAELVSLWACYVNGNTDFIINKFEDEPKRTFNQYAFESAALSGNKVATEYYFQKLTLKEREMSLMETVLRVIEKRCLANEYSPLDFPLEKFSDVVAYLLSHMSKAQQTEVFQKQPFATLVCFLDWPWQDLFMDIAKQAWMHLSIEEYRALLTMLSPDYNNPAIKDGNLFMEFFRQSPNHYRKSLFVDIPFEYNSSDFCYRMFPILYEDLQYMNLQWFENLIDTNECIKLVLSSMNRSDREQLVDNDDFVDVCVKLVKNDKWSFLELIFEYCELSERNKQNLIYSFNDCFVLKQKYGYKKRISILRKKNFLKLLENSTRVSTKRRIAKSAIEQPATSKRKRIKFFPSDD